EAVRRRLIGARLSGLRVIAGIRWLGCGWFRGNAEHGRPFKLLLPLFSKDRAIRGELKIAVISMA
ncbi:hypothetical protein ACQJ25_27415, partial [Klebsiella pneumoniae]|uniref:hypothetical protein n=1 Tax=Klebsiella pneumoniae TaxID=573 RepID=UPI003D07E055